MTVYIDDAKIPYRNMKMCHMVGDTTDELLDMARKIGVRVKWIQYPDIPDHEHFDICSRKRALAIRHGAVPVSQKDLVLAIKNRGIGGKLPFCGGQAMVMKLKGITT